MDNRYNRHNRRKYSLKVHIVLVSKFETDGAIVFYIQSIRITNLLLKSIRTEEYRS